MKKINVGTSFDEKNKSIKLNLYIISQMVDEILEKMKENEKIESQENLKILFGKYNLIIGCRRFLIANLMHKHTLKTNKVKIFF